MMQAPSLSVIIPIAEGGCDFRLQRSRLMWQNYHGDFEIIYIDSRKDKSTPLAEQSEATVISISPLSFGHGRTRNLGVRSARGEYIAFLSEDALPRGQNFLEELVTALCSAERAVCAVSARQLPRSEHSAFARRLVFASPYASEDPIYVPINNVASCIRKDVLLAHPFDDEIPFGEDAELTKRLQKLEYRCLLAPKAVVLHSHDRSIGYTFYRFYADSYLWAKDDSEKSPTAEVNYMPVNMVKLFVSDEKPVRSAIDFVVKSVAALAGSRLAKRDAKKHKPPISKGKV